MTMGRMDHDTRAGAPRTSGPRADPRFGVLLPTGQAQWGAGTNPRRLIDFAVTAERLGYASVWANDSLLKPRIEPLAMLAAAAAVTERVTLGTAALLPAFRRPVQAAQAIASVDLLSGGRLALAVGAGFPGMSEVEHALSDVPWKGRFARLDDTVALWRHLWTGDGPGSFHGRVLHLDDLPAATRPARVGGPPIWLAGATAAALARTGRLYDGWLPYPPDPADYTTGLADVRQAAKDAGRDPDAITPALFATVLVDDDPAAGRRLLEEYCLANYGLPMSMVRTVQVLISGSLDHVASELARYVAAGTRHVLLRIGALSLDAQLDQITRLAALLP
jgi:alkanesulfonate monooxygenase SsuD/methylene tetrahydromethanopterin reductase-like flavin-dependent oxidoreductase (luciferase family)